MEYSGLLSFLIGGACAIASADLTTDPRVLECPKLSVRWIA